MNTRSDRGQHAGEDLEPEVLFVAQPVGATLEHADLVVQALDEAERHLVLRVAVGGDAVPVPRDHCGKLLVGAEPLPLQSGAPVVEEAPGPALPLVLPELAEGLLEDVGGVEPLVRGEQRLESAPAVERQWRSCSPMYCVSMALTLCQSSRSSLSTSRIEEARQRRPT